tara:strand:- start:412 stop:594 length:183 start_codon:yes stop_codon:yes gene_type:complete
MGELKQHNNREAQNTKKWLLLIAVCSGAQAFGKSKHDSPKHQRGASSIKAIKIISRNHSN